MKTVAHNTQDFSHDPQLERIIGTVSRLGGIALFVLALIGIAYLIVASIL